MIHPYWTAPASCFKHKHRGEIASIYLSGMCWTFCFSSFSPASHPPTHTHTPLLSNIYTRWYCIA